MYFFLKNIYYIARKSFLPIEYRLGKDFFRYLARYERSQWWSKEEIAEYQFENIQKIIKYAYENVTFYNKYFKEHGIHPEDIKKLDDVEKIPFLTKKDIQNNKDKLLSNKYHKSKVLDSQTGGTTGAPVDFYQDKQTIIRINALNWRYWRMFGYRFGDKCIVLRGNNKTRKNRYNYNKDHLEMSTRDLDDNKIKDFLKKTRKIKPAYIKGYPSLVYLVAEYINRTKEYNDIDFIKTVFCASEKLFLYQKNAIQHAFNSKVVEHYGSNENVVLGHHCDKSKNIHIVPENGFLELVDHKGKVIKEPGKIGEIVGTGFNNYAFPFIRYRTGDMASYAIESCECGRNWKEIEEIHGRFGDFIVTLSNKYISPTVLEFAFDPIRNIKEWQVIQKQKDYIEILIKRDKNYDMESEKILKKGINDIINESVLIKIRYVDRIEKPANMKYRFVLNEIPDKAITSNC